MALATTPQQTVAVSLSTASTTEGVAIASVPVGEQIFIQVVAGTSSQVVVPTCTNVTFKLVSYDPFATASARVYRGVVAGGASGTTITFTGSTAFNTQAVNGFIVEWRGAAANMYHVSAANASSGVVTSPSVIPVAGQVAVVLAFGRSYAGGTLSSGPTGGFTDPGVSGSIFSRFAYNHEASTSGAYATTWTFSNTGNNLCTILVLYETAPVGIMQTGDCTFSNGGAVASWTANLLVAPTQGRTLVFTFTGPSTANDISSISCTGLTFSSALLTIGSNKKTRTYYATVGSNPDVVVTVNQSPSGSPGFWDVSAVEFDGLPTSGGYYATASASAGNSTGTAVATGSVTPHTDREVVLVAMLAGNGTVPSVPAGWTKLKYPSSAVMMMFRVETASGSYSASGTFGTSSAWAASIATFETGVLVFTQQPTNLAAGANFSPTVTLEARTNGTSVDTAVTAIGTLSVASGDALLSGTAAQAAASGVSTFTGLGVTSGSGAQTLRARMPGYTPVVSSSFTVSASGISPGSRVASLLFFR